LESLFDLYLVEWPGGSWQNTLKIAGVIFGVYLFAIYLASIYWSYRDIRQRTRDPISQLISVLLVVVLFLPGLWIYLILRPRYTLVELYERSLEEEALLQELEDQKACPNCRRRVDDEYVVCPTCRMQLREPCLNCGRALSHAWLACPYCGSDKAPALAAPRRSYVAEPYDDYGRYYELDEAEDEGWPAAQIAEPAETERPRRRRRPAPEPAATSTSNGKRPPEFETAPGQPRPRPVRDALARAAGKLANGSKSGPEEPGSAAAAAASTTETSVPAARQETREASPAPEPGRSASPAQPEAAKETPAERPRVRLGLDTARRPDADKKS
jgi:RNA polymerase subunit RPABC4/transcription elongation factor Spt4